MADHLHTLRIMLLLPKGMLEAYCTETGIEGHKTMTLGDYCDTLGTALEQQRWALKFEWDGLWHVQNQKMNKRGHHIVCSVRRLGTFLLSEKGKWYLAQPRQSQVVLTAVTHHGNPTAIMDFIETAAHVTTEIESAKRGVKEWKPTGSLRFGLPLSKIELVAADGDNHEMIIVRGMVIQSLWNHSDTKHTKLTPSIREAIQRGDMRALTGLPNAPTLDNVKVVQYTPIK